MIEDVVSYVFPITDQLDEIMADKNWYEEDGSRWRRIKEDSKWRWQPLNWQAFGKGEPDSKLTDIYLPPNSFRAQAEER